ncbi:hypothetical protein F4X88_09160 [Candidatus Poribacteria bacterium]|nr:hypothetical protein [Candidatus Poribacteria bacterium]MYA56450.1 hypothetical protein [Candidatus Poribacteria bacterium]
MKKFRIFLSITLFSLAIGMSVMVAEKRIRSISDHTSCECHSTETLKRQTRTVDPSVSTPENTCGCS